VPSRRIARGFLGQSDYFWFRLLSNFNRHLMLLLSEVKEISDDSGEMRVERSTANFRVLSRFAGRPAQPRRRLDAK